MRTETIAEFLARGGQVAHCPTAALVPCGGAPGAEDARELRQRFDRGEAAQASRARLLAEAILSRYRMNRLA